MLLSGCENLLFLSPTRDQPEEVHLCTRPLCILSSRVAALYNHIMWEVSAHSFTINTLADWQADAGATSDDSRYFRFLILDVLLPFVVFYTYTTIIIIIYVAHCLKCITTIFPSKSTLMPGETAQGAAGKTTPPPLRTALRLRDKHRAHQL